MTPRRLGDPPRHLLLPALDGEIDIRDLAPEHGITHRPADGPNPLAVTERVANGTDRRCGRQAV
jgi:hypothetical protein